jgi:hypothetical protein
MSQQPTNLKDRLIKDSTGEGSGTRLRSLKYGRDREGGGNSREPFITEPLPGVEEDNPNVGLLGNGDFLLRAGSIERSFDDVRRITKFFTTGKGLGFVAKQNLLSRTNVKPQGAGALGQGAYVPTNTLAQVGVSAAGGHLVKQGLNPFRDLSVDPIARQSTAPSGDGFFAKALNTVKRGIEVADQATSFPLYLNQVSNDQEGDRNRLVLLRDSKISVPAPAGIVQGALGLAQSLLGGIFQGIGASFNLPGLNRAASNASSLVGKVSDTLGDIQGLLKGENISSNKGEILNYSGGPGSFLGIGNTSIKRYSDTTAYNTESFRSKYYLLNSGQIQQRADLAVQNPGKILQDFRADLLSQQSKGQKKNILSAPTDLENKNLETRVGLGDPGTSQKNLTSYTKGSGIGPIDKVNALPLYESTGVTANPKKNDFVKFRFAVVDTNNPTKKTYIHFRAFIDGFTDNYTSNYETIRYMGRTDPLYRFQGFERNVVLSWTIAAQSKEELMVMYSKLNYLQSVMTGDYTSKGYFAGNIVNMTVGGYFWETPGVITSMNISVPGESPWEIGLPDSEANAARNAGQSIPTDLSTREMPHIIQVTGFAFNPIHDFAPRKQQNVYNDNGTLKEFGKERFVALKAETGKSSYDNDGDGEVQDQFQFNPNGQVKVSKLLSEITPSGVQKFASIKPQSAMPSSQISKKLQGLSLGG